MRWSLARDANINRLGFNIVTILQVDIEYILGILYTMYNLKEAIT